MSNYLLTLYLSYIDKIVHFIDIFMGENLDYSDKNKGVFKDPFINRGRQTSEIFGLNHPANPCNGANPHHVYIQA